jgi:hypothetical protein
MRFRLPPFQERKRAYIAGIGAVVVIGLGLLGFGPYVRHKAEAAATARGFTIEIGSVRPAWFGAVLSDVKLRPEGTTSVNVHIEEVMVDLTPMAAHAHGGKLTLEGPTAIDDLIAWRARRPQGSGETSAHKTAIDADAMEASWTGGELDFEAHDIVFRRDDSGTHVETVRAHASSHGISADLGKGILDLDAHGKLSNAHADDVELGVVLQSEAKAPAPPSPDPPPPPIIPVVKRPGKAPPQPYGPLFTLPDLHDLRTKVRTAVTAFAGRATDDVHADVPAVSLSVTRGTDKVEIGPGSFSLKRSPSDLTIDFASRASPGKPPLALRIDAPIAAGDVVAQLSGGPVTLSLLGVKEGQAGLVDVERATLAGDGRGVMTDAGDTVRFDGQVTLKGVSIQHDGIASDTVRNLDLLVSGRGSLGDKGTLALDDAELALGAVHFRAKGKAEQAADHLAVELTYELPTAACESLHASIPTALLPILATARFKGTLGMTGSLAFDTRDLDSLVLRYNFDDRCKLDLVPAELDRDRFDGSFTYWAVDKDGRPIELESGPHTLRWTPLDEISPYMQVAVLTTEDGLFYKHKGFNHSAIRQSLIANLKAHKFVRGASTITMQLAKNLYLSREKTLARKLQEIVLADALEQTLTKDQMMELYLNIIEFGPDIYGVGQAAEHYFGRNPAELNLAECLFLSSLLPRPKESYKFWEKGELPVWWAKNIQTLMEIAQKTSRITEKELEEGKAETIVFHKDGDPRPVARPPVRAPRIRDSHGEDFDGWNPTQ